MGHFNRNKRRPCKRCCRVLRRRLFPGVWGGSVHGESVGERLPGNPWGGRSSVSPRVRVKAAGQVLVEPVWAKAQSQEELPAVSGAGDPPAAAVISALSIP